MPPCSLTTLVLPLLLRLPPPGLLRAYLAASSTAAKIFNSNPTIPRLAQGAPQQQLMAHLLHDPVQLLAAASTAMLGMWCSVAEFMPAMDLMQPQSLVLDTVTPSAALAMALARTYAGDKTFAAPALVAVLKACMLLARAAVPSPDYPSMQPNLSMVACQDVRELIPLGFAVSLEQLHVEYKGVSHQTLVPRLRTPAGGSSGAKGSKQVAVSPLHEELLQALLGVRRLAGLAPRSAALVRDNGSLLPGAVDCALVARVLDARSSGSSSSMASASAKQAVNEGEMWPWQLALPLHLAQIEVTALVPPYFADRLSIMQKLLTGLQDSTVQLRKLSLSQLWQQPPSNLPPLDTVKAQVQLCLEAVWLQLGPVLLSLCRRRSGEAEDDGPVTDGPTVIGASLEGVTPRQLFATYSQVFLSAVCWQGEVAGNLSLQHPGRLHAHASHHRPLTLPSWLVFSWLTK